MDFKNIYVERGRGFSYSAISELTPKQERRIRIARESNRFSKSSLIGAIVGFDLSSIFCLDA